MLYLDSSVLAKFYFNEVGSDSLFFRVKAGNRAVAASLLAFAEVHAAIARKRREKAISSAAFFRLREQFEKDWSTLIDVIDLNALTLAALPRLVEQFPLKAGDAIQLSTALWLNDHLKEELGPEGTRSMEFAASDQILVGAARQCGLLVFDPEE
jgi:predicted nucleic acid-binding protein